MPDVRSFGRREMPVRSMFYQLVIHIVEHTVQVNKTRQMLGLNQVDFYGFDLDALQSVADRIGPSPEELGQSDGQDLSKWDALRNAGRPWLTGKEAYAAVTD